MFQLYFLAALAAGGLAYKCHYDSKLRNEGRLLERADIRERVEERDAAKQETYEREVAEGEEALERLDEESTRKEIGDTIRKSFNR